MAGVRITELSNELSDNLDAVGGFEPCVCVCVCVCLSVCLPVSVCVCAALPFLFSLLTFSLTITHTLTHSLSLPLTHTITGAIGIARIIRQADQQVFSGWRHHPSVYDQEIMSRKKRPHLKKILSLLAFFFFFVNSFSFTFDRLTDPITCTLSNSHTAYTHTLFAFCACA